MCLMVKSPESPKPETEIGSRFTLIRKRINHSFLDSSFFFLSSPDFFLPIFRIALKSPRFVWAPKRRTLTRRKAKEKGNWDFGCRLGFFYQFLIFYFHWKRVHEKGLCSNSLISLFSLKRLLESAKTRTKYIRNKRHVKLQKFNRILFPIL